MKLTFLHAPTHMPSFNCWALNCEPALVTYAQTSSWANTSEFGWQILEISWEKAIKNWYGGSLSIMVFICCRLWKCREMQFYKTLFTVHVQLHPWSSNIASTRCTLVWMSPTQPSWLTSESSRWCTVHDSSIDTVSLYCKVTHVHLHLLSCFKKSGFEILKQ